tara:strand:- start:169 stop:375 length:207 start_codon:yes stop_codon:yes gene_type:complete
MEIWVLYFWAAFASGEQAIMQNEDTFESSAACHLVGLQKAGELQVMMHELSGIPVQVKFRCSNEGTPT